MYASLREQLMTGAIRDTVTDYKAFVPVTFIKFNNYR